MEAGLLGIPPGIQGSATVIGTVAFFVKSSAPTGWLKCNGAAISRFAYSKLFAEIGISSGAGDGATTFNVPDLRAEFIRGLDDGRGVDSGRVLASAQSGDNASHSHSINMGTGVCGGVAGMTYVSGYTGTTPVGGLTASSGSESRPRNVALLACIRYQ